MSAGNSCHGNAKKQCSLLCFVSFWLVTEWEENATQLWWVREGLHDLLLESLGKFLIGGEIFGSLGIFSVITAVPFLHGLIPQERLRFFYVVSLYGMMGDVQSGSGVGVWLQQSGRHPDVKCITCFQAKVTESCSPAIICNTGLMWFQSWCFFLY